MTGDVEVKVSVSIYVEIEEKQSHAIPIFSAFQRAFGSK